MKQLRLEVIFGSKNNTLSPALRSILGSSNAATKALKKTRDEIRKLNEQQKKIDGYQKQKKAVQDQGKALQDLQNHIKNLRQQMKTNPSADLTRDFEKSVQKAKKLKQEYERNRIELQRMRTEMNNAGLSTNRLSEHQQRLRNDLNRANQSMREQEQRLQRMTQMQQNYERHAGRLRAAAGYGMGAAMTGAGALYTMRKPIEESKRTDVEEHRIASLGLGKKATEEAILYAKAMKTYGTSTLENLTLVRDGITAFGDVHHAEMVAPTLAKMKFANEAMFGSEGGAENEKKFMDMLKVIELRGGLKSEKAFNDQANIIQQVITATGGRVQGEEWLNVIKTGGIAAKGIDNKAFYYKMEPLVQEMGGFRVGTAMMSAYQNLYQGRTTQRAMGNLDKFGLIGDPSKVKHNKTGDLSYLDIGAIKGADLFKKDQFAWMEQVLVPALNAKGITKEGDVVDAIGSIFSNRTASNLFAQMYQQRDQIHKNAKLNEGANNIDQLYAQGKDTTTGKELEAKAKLHDAYLRFGQTILPIYTKAIEIATGAMAAFTGWMQRNPTLAKILGAGLLTIAVSLVAIGGALVVFSPLILGMLSLRLVMGTLGVQGGVLTRIFGLLSLPLTALTTRFGSLTTKILGLANILKGTLMTAWLASRPTNFIASLKQLPSVMKTVILNGWLMAKTFGMNLYQSLINAAKGAWLFATTLGKNVVGALRSYILAATIAIRTNGLLGTSKLLLRNAALGLWAALRGGGVGIFTTLATGARLAAQSILFLGRAMLMNPIGLIITAIAGAAFLIYKYWQPIKAFFTGFWQGLTEGLAPFTTALAPLFQTIGTALAPLKPVWDWLVGAFKTAWKWVSQLFQPFQATKQQLDSATSSGKVFGLWLSGLVNTVANLVGKFFNFGANIVGGLINGIMSKFEKLKSVWATVTSYIPDYFKQKQEIRSPSRVMARLGGHIMGGIGLGLEQGFPNIKDKFQHALNIFNPNDAISKIDVAPALSKVRTVPSIATSRGSGSYTIQGDTITIQITQAPGQNLQQLQAMLENMLNKREREKMARVRSSFKDQE